jgi:hypothetical protein
MSRRSTKQEPSSRESDENLLGFLVRNLPPSEIKQAQYLADTLKDAGARYDRYAAKASEWLHYKPRRSRLKSIVERAQELTSDLQDLDIVSRDELASRIDPREVDTLVGSLMRLGREMSEVYEEAQTSGRPRDLAEERWILELADIYENTFRDAPTANRPVFRRLLELSRPQSFLRYGKLNPKQIDRTLKRRKTAHQAVVIRDRMLR